MRKNVASQIIGAQMNSRTDGSPLTSAVSISVVGDNGAAAAGGGTLAHKGDGYWSYVPTQAETNYVHVAFTFTHASGVNQTVQAYPVAYNYGDAVRLGITALPNAAADAAGGLPISDAGGLDLDTLLTRLDAAMSTRATPAQVAAELATYDAPTRAELTSDINSVIALLPASLSGGRIRAVVELINVGVVDATALATNAVDEIVAAVLAGIIEGTVTLKQSLQLSNAAAAAKLSGAATTTATLRNLADTIDRIVATVDADGNRTAVARTFE
jgi:hypothetical protein